VHAWRLCADRVLTETVESTAHLTSEDWIAFVSLGSAWQRFAAIRARSKYNEVDRQGFEENGMFGDTPLPGWRTWAVLVLVIVIGVIGFLAYETLTYK
jgi:hypothetical protein